MKVISEEEVAKRRIRLNVLTSKMKDGTITTKEKAERKKMTNFLLSREKVVVDGVEMSYANASKQALVLFEGNKVKRSYRDKNTLVLFEGKLVKRFQANNNEMVTGVNGEQITRQQRNNAMPAHKIYSRNSQIKKQTKALSFKRLTKPHVDTLLQERTSVVNFINKNQALKDLITGSLEGVSALDSATSYSPWNARSTKAGKSAGASRKGSDLYRFAIFNRKTEMWLEGWRMTPVDGSGNFVKSGTERSACNVIWRVYTWPKDEWAPPGTDYKRTDGEELAEDDAQDRVIKFVENTTILEYNNCDHKRIDSWLAINGKPPLVWLDLCCGVCMSNSENIQAIFGPKPKAISPSVNARLETISNDLFLVDGPSNAGPKVGTAAHAAGLIPYLVEINPEDCNFSDDTLDVQNLFNLFVVLRLVYRNGWGEEKTAEGGG
ncbi:hypothetical protein ScalyP_jg990, partial [Parmales sp. scaly parma]